MKILTKIFFGVTEATVLVALLSITTQIYLRILPAATQFVSVFITPKLIKKTQSPYQYCVSAFFRYDVQAQNRLLKEADLSFF